MYEIRDNTQDRARLSNHAKRVSRAKNAKGAFNKNNQRLSLPKDSNIMDSPVWDGDIVNFITSKDRSLGTLERQLFAAPCAVLF